MTQFHDLKKPLALAMARWTYCIAEGESLLWRGDRLLAQESWLIIVQGLDCRRDQVRHTFTSSFQALEDWHHERGHNGPHPTHSTLHTVDADATQLSALTGTQVLLLLVSDTGVINTGTMSLATTLGCIFDGCGNTVDLPVRVTICAR